MKKSRYSDSQMLAIIKQAESGVPISELCREHGMSNASFYNCEQSMVVWMRH
jgi:putative transposase